MTFLPSVSFFFLSLSLSSHRDWSSLSPWLAVAAATRAIVACCKCALRPPRAATACYRPRPASSCAATASSCNGAATTCGPMRRRRLLAPMPPPAHARSRPHALSPAADPCPAQPAAGFPCAPSPRVALASNHTAGEEAMAAREAAGAKWPFTLDFNTV